LWQPSGLEKGRMGVHIHEMTSGTWTDERFECPKCGMWYVATREQDPEPEPGSFDCTVCKSEIKSWSGNTRYFGWKQLTMKAPSGGKI
jgi:transcription elongation factor Elf1